MSSLSNRLNTGTSFNSTISYDEVDVVFVSQNTTGEYANSSYNHANSAFNQANSAFNQANTANTNAATASQRAVTSGSYANSAYAQANTSNQRAVTSGVYANSAYGQANTATTNAATADQRAVTSGSYANSAFSKANTATILAQASFNAANTGGGGGGGGGAALANGTQTFSLTEEGNVIFSGETGGVNRGLVWDYGAETGGQNSIVRQDDSGLTVRAYTEAGDGVYAAPVNIVTNQGENEKWWRFRYT
jgi:hypothetical protein